MYECYYTRNFAAVKKKIKLHAQTHTNSYATLSETCPKLLKAPFVCQWLQVKILGFLLLSKKGLHRQDGTATVRGDPRVIP